MTGGPAAPPRPPELLAEAQAGSHAALGRLLSFVERGGPRSREVARLAYQAAPPYTVGLTGSPGAGKSTLTDRLVAVAKNRWPPGPGSAREAPPKVAVLAVDPTSPFSGGAILGDRVRMQQHATDDRVFIRSMATRGHLGGLALAVPDALRLLGAVGFPVVFVETVGVGQVEVEVASAADTTVVVVTPGWGDAMQASKAGLLEVADVFVINKADRPGAREARRDLDQMLDLSTTAPGWRPPIVDTVATTGEGVEDLFEALAGHRQFLADHGELDRRRHERLRGELYRALNARLERRARAAEDSEAGRKVLGEVLSGVLDPYEGAERLEALVAEGGDAEPLGNGGLGG